MLAATRTRADWLLVGGVCITLFVMLLVVTQLTPYQAPTSQPSLSFVAPTNSDQPTNPPYQRMRLTETPKDGTAKGLLLDGERQGQMALVNSVNPTNSHLRAGDTVIVLNDTTSSADTAVFTYIDTLRLPGVFILAMLFILAVVLISGRRGLMSVVGLLLSMLVIGWYIIPLIMHGHNAFFVALSGAYIIATVSVLVAHGRRRRTYISIGCIYLILALIALLAWLATWLASLTGVSDEVAYWLSVDMKNIDMQGIMVGGIIIATLGVLDDVVTTQVAAVEEIHKARPEQSGYQLFRAASSVGNEHISSLVNTLALAYAGASLPLIILTIHQTNSLFLAVNSEYIMVEVVRTLVASLGLVMAVPLSTLAATAIYKKRP